MFKQFVFLCAMAVCFVSCNSKKSDAATAETVYEVESLLTVADQQIDHEVMIKGIVTHVCKHSGKKCFITDEAGELSMQIMAGGDIASFDQDLVGSAIRVKGVVKEHRQEKNVIDDLEKETLEMQESGEASHDQCESSLASINKMREWMKANNKDYYAIYYMDGLAYEVVD